MNSLATTINPGSTIGILGGGQLGRMLAVAAGKLGYKTICLDPDPQPPAAQFCNAHIKAAFDDLEGLGQLAQACDVITFEFENIPAHAMEHIDKHYTIRPGIKALTISQDRAVEKNFLSETGLQPAPWEIVKSSQSLRENLEKFGAQAILKTRRLGYDGKGQVRLNTTTSPEIWQQAGQLLEQGCILEQTVDFRCEISVIGARDLKGMTVCYEPARNHHEHGILRTSTVPCEVNTKLVELAITQTRSLMQALDYCGVMGVEFFVTRDDQLLVNEFAPRVHNSGHWTQAVCTIDQFEQHIRAITGLPLGDGSCHAPCTMKNLLGDEILSLPQLANNPSTYVCDYGKAEVKNGRKMGHVIEIMKHSTQ